MSVVLLSTQSSHAFAEQLASRMGCPVGLVDRQQFPDGENYLRYAIADHFGLLGKHVVIVGATECGTSLEEIYRLGCTATKHGAKSLILVIPYFGYATMERAVRPGEVVTAKMIARQLSSMPRASLGNWAFLLDLHSPGIVHYFEGDTVALELSAEGKVLNAIEKMGLSNLCLASTDMGRAKWVEGLANRLHAPIALIHKKRVSGSQTRINAVVGDVQGKNVVIYDDMIRTGGSLTQAVEAYSKAGAASIHALTTHLVIPPGTVAKLEGTVLERIVGTNSHPNHLQVIGRPRFEIISVVDLFVDVLSRLVN